MTAVLSARVRGKITIDYDNVIELTAEEASAPAITMVNRLDQKVREDIAATAAVRMDFSQVQVSFERKEL